MSIITKIFGDPNARAVAKYRAAIAKIAALEPEVSKLTDEEIVARTAEFRKRIADGAKLDDLLPEAFASAREAARRAIGQRHYDVQLIGGMILHSGAVAEMRTGEGKTLVATAPVYLNALTGKGVHLVTVNDYLARRDAAWMGKIYHALGLTVGIINHETSYLFDPHYEVSSSAEAAPKPEIGREDGRPGASMVKIEYANLRPCTRQEAYRADVTYGTNNEFGFDYLRDHMVTRPEDRTQRAPNFAIVDEVDSILIDEARTPLIISAPAEEATQAYYDYAAVVRRLVPEVDYNVDEKMHSATYADAGIGKVAQHLGRDPWKENDFKTVFHLDAALKAHALYKLDRNYVVRENEVVIVDEFTGRLMHGRRYSEGLHQAIEAKEGVKIQRESQTLATITFQNLFRMYPKLSGMTGTAATEAEEFHKIYKLEVVTVPTNKPAIRRDEQDRIYKSEPAKFAAVVREVKERVGKGQPVLLGTISIEKNEVLSNMLSQEGVPHNILNAKNHEKEAEFISQAGRPGAVTLATNMAGRGVDIILGGNPPDSELAKHVREAGGLHVIGTERHESRRIDNQLRGRAGRQGDPGSSQFFVSLDDDLMRVFATPRIKSVLEKLGLPDDMPIENSMVSRAIESAQGKVEGHHFDIRKHLLEYDDVLNKHREAVYRRRTDILESEDQEPVIFEMVEREVERIVQFHTAAENRRDWNLKEIVESALTIFPLPPDAEKTFESFMNPEPGEGSAELASGKLGDAEIRTKIIDYLAAAAREAKAGLKARFKDPAVLPRVERGILLRSIDTLWVEHLDSMDHLRAGINLRGYGQRDPLVEYKRDSFRMFNELLAMIDKQVVYSVFKIGFAAQAQEAQSLLNRRGVVISAPAKTSDDLRAGEGEGMAKAAASSIETGEKIGRNDPCPCGSGLKFKKCGLMDTEEHRKNLAKGVA
jgi:preprotein translocase subunit SecA